ncbi:Uncharacterised protein [Escherichia coli]|uniref:Uncharacterized protein n=1 Tax=Escherichia coli TaxID=562 RepID=A0A2X3KL84_ECOLX|nr:Uncharacterised protein [Escherichia coli]
MSMGDEVGYGAGIAPHPNGEREKTSAIFNIEHNRSPRPSGERVRVRGPARTFPLITPPQSPSHQTRLKTRRQRILHQPRIKLVADMVRITRGEWIT